MTARSFIPLWPVLEAVVLARQPTTWRGARPNADGWLTGFHSPLRDDDDHPSFAVKPDSETSPGAFKDFGTNDGGSMAELASRLGRDPRGGGNEATSHGQTRRVQVAEYNYLDLNGRWYKTVRYDPKGFRQCQCGEDGVWVWNLKGILPNLYHREDLDAADPEEPVLYCEGERDADAARARGFVATTHAMGAGKFPAVARDALADRHIAVLEDNDDAGREHAAKGAALFHGTAASVRIVRLPGLPDKGDLTDWFDRGGTAEELRDIIKRTPPWLPEAGQSERPSGAVRICLADVQPEEVTWLWPGRIPFGKVTLLVGDPGLGKSFLSLYLASRLSTGSPLQGEVERPPKITTLLLSAEDDLGDTIRPRLDRMNADVTHIHALQAILEKDKDERDIERMVRLDTDLVVLERQIVETGARFVIVDPINAYMGKTDGNQDIDLRRVLNPLALMAARYKVAVLVVTHSNKRSEGNKLHRVMGSLAYVGLARSVLAVGADPDEDGRRNLIQIKNNLAAHAPGLGYRIIEGEVVWDSDPVSLTPDTVFDAPNAGQTKQDAGSKAKAIAFLRDVLANGPVYVKDVYAEGKNEDPKLPERTIDRAKAELGVKSRKEGFGEKGKTYWSLPETNTREWEQR